MKRCAWIAVLLCAATTGSGILLGYARCQVTSTSTRQSLARIETLRKLSGVDRHLLFHRLLSNNLRVLGGIILSYFTAGLLGFQILFLNSLQLGRVLKHSCALGAERPACLVRVAIYGTAELGAFISAQLYVLHMLYRTFAYFKRGDRFFAPSVIVWPLTATGAVFVGAYLEVHIVRFL